MSAERQVGAPLDWRPALAPARRELRGDHVVLRPVDPARDAPALYAESHPPRGTVQTWTYLPYGPFSDAAALEVQLDGFAQSTDPLFFTLAPLPRERAAGIASYLRITPTHGTIEIGHIWFGASLRATTAATEAIFLLAAHAFEALGYRRLEWKCDALNAASRRAAERFGFRFEGIFRQHQVVKGRNRDTAWFAITDGEWPALAAAFRAWLNPANLDASGRQRAPLGALIAAQRAGGA